MSICAKRFYGQPRDGGSTPNYAAGRRIFAYPVTPAGLPAVGDFSEETPPRSRKGRGPGDCIGIVADLGQPGPNCSAPRHQRSRDVFHGLAAGVYAGRGTEPYLFGANPRVRGKKDPEHRQDYRSLPSSAIRTSQWMGCCRRLTSGGERLNRTYVEGPTPILPRLRGDCGRAEADQAMGAAGRSNEEAERASTMILLQQPAIAVPIRDEAKLRVAAMLPGNFLAADRNSAKNRFKGRPCRRRTPAALRGKHVACLIAGRRREQFGRGGPGGRL